MTDRSQVSEKTVVQKVVVTVLKHDGSQTTHHYNLDSRQVSGLRDEAVRQVGWVDDPSVFIYRYMRNLFRAFGLNPRFLELTGGEIQLVEIVEGLGAGSFIRFKDQGHADEIVMIDENGMRIPTLTEKISWLNQRGTVFETLQKIATDRHKP